MTALFTFKDRSFAIDATPLIMGILNVTPDSFSDGGSYTDSASVTAQARKLIAQGIDILDIGGESTRPGAPACPIEEEIARVVPAIRAIRDFSDIPISIDTRKTAVAQAAIDAGADIINDVSGGIYDPSIFALAAQTGAGLILMHARATPETMQEMCHTHYNDLHGEIIAFLQEQTAKAQDAGVAPTCIVPDPGLGFAKTAQQNIDILDNLQLYAAAFPQRPLLIGHSRKRFLSTLGIGDSVAERDAATQEISARLAQTGFPLILRVHNP